MLFRTHLAFGLLIGLLFVEFFSLNYLWLILVLFFSVVVDIDEVNSKIGKKFKFFSFFIKLIFKHRGLVHSLFIPLVIFVVLWFFGYNLIGLVVLVGYSSHLFLDMLNVSGIRLFYPLDFKIKGFVKTGSILENILFFIILILIFLFIV